MGCEIFMMGRCQKETRIWRDEVVVREREREVSFGEGSDLVHCPHSATHSLFSPFQEGVKLVYFCRRFRSDEGSRLEKNKNLHLVIGKLAKW